MHGDWNAENGLEYDASSGCGGHTILGSTFAHNVADGIYLNDHHDTNVHDVSNNTFNNNSDEAAYANVPAPGSGNVEFGNASGCFNVNCP